MLCCTLCWSLGNECIHCGDLVLYSSLVVRAIPLARRFLRAYSYGGASEPEELAPLFGRSSSLFASLVHIARALFAGFFLCDIVFA